MVRKSPSDGLGKAGQALWADITAVYALSPAELGMLGRACRCADRMAAMDEELAASGLVVAGSTGQPSANPLLHALIEAERTFDVLLRALALPMPNEKAGKVRSPSAVMAARTRWDQEKAGG